MDGIETQEEVKIGISPVVKEYSKYKDVEGVSAIDQALHPAVLNNIPWDEETPGKIAEFALQVARDEALGWADDRRDSYWIEKDESYNKAR